MERGLSRLPTMEQRALYKLTSVEKLAEYGATLGHSASSRRHYGVSDEFEEDLRSRAFASRSARRQLSIASQVANRPESDPMMCDWEDRRRSNDEELQKLRTMVSGARLAANRGTGYYSERKYKMSG